MKKIVMPLLALVITLGLVIPAAQGDHFKAQYKGLGGDAYWSIYDADTGVQTDVIIYAVDQLYQNPPNIREGTHFAYVSISQYRYDADEYVPIRDVYCYGDLLPESLVVDRNLTSASLTAYGLQGWQWDYATETETPVTLDINVNWSAIGPINNYRYFSHYRYPNGFSHNNSTGKGREAIALGEVVLDGISIMPEASVNGEIFSSKDGYVDVFR